MTTVADDNNMQDWAADCNREGQERAVRDGGDSGVVMMAVAVEDGSGGQQWRRRTTIAAEDIACKIGRRTQIGKEKSGRQEKAERAEWQ